MRCAALAAGSAALLAVPGSASAVTINASNNGDENAAHPDNGICTLREAITAVNTNMTVDSCVHGGAVEPDTINLAPGDYTLAIAGTDENANVDGDLDIDLTGGSLTIDGPDSGGVATVKAQVGLAERILHSQAVSTNGLTLKDLVITGGDSSLNGVGGGVLTSGQNGLTIDHSAITSNTALFHGGGVFFSGGGGAELRVSNSIIRNNQATNADASSEGGGIRAFGPVTITKSLIESNTATSNSIISPRAAAGGGIWDGLNTTSEELVIRDSSIVNNHAVATNAADAQGGGVASLTVVEITNSTFSGNTATSSTEARGGGLAFQAPSGTHSIFHATFDANDATGSPTIGEALAASGAGSIAAGGNVFTGPNFVETCERYGPNALFTLDMDAGANLDDGTSCDLDSAADENQDPNLLALAPAGSFLASADSAGPPGALEPLPVQVPRAGSAAVDHASHPADCVDADEVPSTLISDERGFPRPVDGDEDGDADCDSGAAEFAPPAPVPPGMEPPATSPSILPAPDPAAPRARKCKKGFKLKKGKCRRKRRGSQRLRGAATGAAPAGLARSPGS